MGVIRQAKRVNGKNQPLNKLMRLKENAQKIISQPYYANPDIGHWLSVISSMRFEIQ